MSLHLASNQPDDDNDKLVGSPRFENQPLDSTKQGYESSQVDLDFLIDLITNLNSPIVVDKTSYTGSITKVQPLNRFNHQHGTQRLVKTIILRFKFPTSLQRDMGSTVEISKSEGRSRENFKLHLELVKKNTKENRTNKVTKREWRLINLLEDVRKYQPKLELLLLEKELNYQLPSGYFNPKLDLTDYACSVRSVEHSLNLELNVSKHFLYLGELDDRYNHFQFSSQTKEIVSCQLFLQVARQTPQPTWELKPTAKFRFVPLHSLLPKPNLNKKVQPIPLVDLFRCTTNSKLVNLGLNRLFGFVNFPGLLVDGTTLIEGIDLNLLSDFCDLGLNPKRIALDQSYSFTNPIQLPLPHFTKYLSRYFDVQLVLDYGINCVPNSLQQRRPKFNRANRLVDNYFWWMKVLVLVSTSWKLVLMVKLLKYCKRLFTSKRK